MAVCKRMSLPQSAPATPTLAFASSRASLPRDGTHGRRTVELGVGCSGLDHYVIDVAVAPVFSGLEGLDDRVSREVVVLGRVLVLRFIAATYVPANEALTQVHPRAPHPEALLAALGGGDHVLPYLIGMRASVSPEHPNLPPTDPAWVTP